jgi:hypothetical protein
MDTLLRKLDSKLRQWKPATSRSVRARVREMIKFADSGTLPLMHPQALAELRQARQDDLAGKFKPWKPRHVPCPTGSK